VVKQSLSDYGGAGDVYALETGFSQASAPAYELPSEFGGGYDNLLSTLDGIFETGEGGEVAVTETQTAPPQPPQTWEMSSSVREKAFNYELMNKFDIRLSKIQEELEASRWEKNLLLEKMRVKEQEDRKQRDQIAELEGKLKAALNQGSALEKEFEQLRYLEEIRAKIKSYPDAEPPKMQSFGGAVTEASGPQHGQSSGGAVTEASGPQDGQSFGVVKSASVEVPPEAGKSGVGASGTQNGPSFTEEATAKGEPLSSQTFSAAAAPVNVTGTQSWTALDTSSASGLEESAAVSQSGPQFPEKAAPEAFVSGSGGSSFAATPLNAEQPLAAEKEEPVKEAQPRSWTGPESAVVPESKENFSIQPAKMETVDVKPEAYYKPEPHPPAVSGPAPFAADGAGGKQKTTIDFGVPRPLGKVEPEVLVREDFRSSFAENSPRAEEQAVVTGAAEQPSVPPLSSKPLSAGDKPELGKNEFVREGGTQKQEMAAPAASGQKVNEAPETPQASLTVPENTGEYTAGRSFRNLRVSGEIKRESSEAVDNSVLTKKDIPSGNLKSLSGRTKIPSGFGISIGGDGTTGQGSGNAPHIEASSKAEEAIYNFKAGASKNEGTAKEDLKASLPRLSPSLERPAEPAAGSGSPGAHPTFQNAWQGQEALQSTGGFGQRQANTAEGTEAASAQLAKQQAVFSPEKAGRVSMQGAMPRTEGERPVKRPGKGGRMAFIAGIMVFGLVVVGGLGVFFLGDGLSLSEFSMLDFNSSKRSAKGSMTSQLEPPAKDKQASPLSGDTQRDVETPEIAAPDRSQNGSLNPAMAQPPEKTAAPLAANEEVKAAIETVKNYRLSGGRGVIGSWFANSFLSGSSGAASEEWSATPLHGDILVVQYRLIRQKQDPLIYQFEVDGAKNDIIRGINNNAMELLDFSSRKTAQNSIFAPKPEALSKRISARKLSARAKPARKPSRPREVPILPLPLPDSPQTETLSGDEPTGFEDVQPEDGEKVRYIRAQESDEELF